jgi:hypothetical protein
MNAPIVVAKNERQGEATIIQHVLSQNYNDQKYQIAAEVGSLKWVFIDLIEGQLWPRLTPPR